MHRTSSIVALFSVIAAATWTPSGGLARAQPVVDEATITLVAGDIASDDTRGRDNLTDGNALARERLIDWMERLELTPAGTTPGSYEQPFASGVNLLAIWHPAGTPARAPVTMIGAHFDHLGTSCSARVEADSDVCNGATDNAGGVASALAAIEAVQGLADTPIALGLWDAEENGLLGSEYFVAQPTFDISSLVVYVNLDIVGLNLFRGAEDVHFVVGTETGGTELQDAVRESTRDLPVTFGLMTYAFGMGRSDMASFINGGLEIPIVFFSDGDGSIYHTTADELKYLNWEKAEAVANAAARLLLEATAAGPFEYQSPILMPIYADAIVADGLYDRLVETVRANELSAAERATVYAYKLGLQRIVAAGEGRFTPNNSAQVAAASLYALDLSADLPFVP